MTDDYMVEFGKLVRKSRLEMGLTQEKLAELLDTCCITIRKIEQGKGNASWKLCTMLSLVLDIDLDNFQKNYVAPYLHERLNTAKIEILIDFPEY